MEDEISDYFGHVSLINFSQEPVKILKNRTIDFLTLISYLIRVTMVSTSTSEKYTKIKGV